MLIRRGGKETVAMTSQAELSSLLETAHLLRSPRNAERLLAALVRARRHDGSAMSSDELVEAVLRDPFSGIGKPEPLKYLAAGAWSRRLTQEHRLVHLVRERRIDFLQARYHCPSSTDGVGPGQLIPYV